MLKIRSFHYWHYLKL